MKNHLCLIFISILFVACSEDQTESLPNDRLTVKEIHINEISLRSDQQSNNIPLEGIISISFSSEISQEQLTDAVSLSQAGNPISFTVNKIGTLAFELIPSNIFRSNTSYKLQISNTLTSLEDLSFYGATYEFITQSKTFEIISLTYGNQEALGLDRAVGIPLDLNLQLSFSSPVLSEALISTISIGRDLELEVIQESDSSLTILSKSVLPSLKRFILTISDNLTGANGETFSGFAQEFYTQLDSTYKFPEISDEALLTKVQEQTFKYFWDFAHPVSGLARERNTSGDIVTIGGSGFGVMAILVGVQRNFITRQQAVERLSTIVTFLESADRFHGVWPHWMNGNTGATIPFSATDNGADLVETAFMIQGLLTARQFLDESVPAELAIINKITALWEAVEWNWFQQEGEPASPAGRNVLTWHWSPNFGFQMNLKIRGWNEALIIYTLAASSPTYPITKEVYEQGWAQNGGIQNGSQSYGITMPLGSNRGGPLFFAHYSFLGMDPTNLEDQYANYWEQNTAHTEINRAYCIANPLNYVGYSEAVWGLTASDNHEGYSAHAPDNDLGVITPTAAISSIPYTPEASMEAIRHFYYLMGDKLWGEYGFYDAFNITKEWYADSYLAIDQGPIIIMIENYRTGFIWDLYMADPDVQAGLTELGFTY